jgi:hypothetical protein
LEGFHDVGGCGGKGPLKLSKPSFSPFFHHKIFEHVDILY